MQYKPYPLIIFWLTFLFLTWCASAPKERVAILDSGDLFTAIPILSGKTNYLTWSLDSSVVISGIYHPIFISWHLLVYSGVFRIGLAQELEEREYVSSNDVISNTMREWMGFVDQSKRKLSSFHIWKLVRPRSELSAQDLCKKEHMDMLVTHSTGTKTIQWRTLYLDYSLMQVAALEAKSRRVEGMYICFVEQGMLYTFSFSNYTKKYMESLVDSVAFED